MWEYMTKGYSWDNTTYTKWFRDALDVEMNLLGKEGWEAYSQTLKFDSQKVYVAYKRWNADL